MIPTRFAPTLIRALACGMLMAPAAHAADDTSTAADAPGPYLGIGLGGSRLGPRQDAGTGSHDDHPGAAKLYGGYRLTDTWGVEAGYARLGRVHEDSVASDGSTVRSTGEARSLYLAGTGRVALGSGFSLTGKAGISFGHVGSKDGSDSGFTLGGSKASPLLGIGAEYRLNRNVSLTVDLDGYGKVSDKVKASTATIGARYSF